MRNVDAGKARKAKDLSVTISANLNVSDQCGIAAVKDNRILLLIRKNIIHKEEEMI